MICPHYGQQYTNGSSLWGRITARTFCPFYSALQSPAVSDFPSSVSAPMCSLDKLLFFLIFKWELVLFQWGLAGNAEIPLPLFVAILVASFHGDPDSMRAGKGPSKTPYLKVSLEKNLPLGQRKCGEGRREYMHTLMPSPQDIHMLYHLLCAMGKIVCCDYSHVLRWQVPTAHSPIPWHTLQNYHIMLIFQH